MGSPADQASPDGPGGRRRVAMAAGLTLLVIVAGLGFLARVTGMGPRASDQDPTRLTTALARTIETKGIDAATAQYRTLRARGFDGLRESAGDTNRLGYVLLRNRQIASAIQIFQLNTETHPRSANVWDSLGEAYMIGGNRQLAIASYEKALAIDPTMKTAVGALQDLTGRKRPPYRPLVFFHILNGLIGIAAGFAAIALRKGSRWHDLAGRVFVISMLSMSGSAVFMTVTSPDGAPINAFMGAFTFYLVATAWLTARRKRPQAHLADWIALAAAIAVAGGLASYGLSAANGETGSRDGVPAAVYFTFGAVAVLAALGDGRMIRRGGVTGAQRLTRHLWRMCVALFIAAGSFFLGQPQFFPAAVRSTGLLAVPTVLVIVSLAYWLFRVNASRWTPAANRSADTFLGRRMYSQES